MHQIEEKWTYSDPFNENYYIQKQKQDEINWWNWLAPWAGLGPHT